MFGEQVERLHRIRTARAWELESAVRGPAPAGVLAADPAIPVYRELIGSVQRGNVVTALPLTYRQLALTTGFPATDDLLVHFTCEPHALINALRTGRHATTRPGSVELVVEAPSRRPAEGGRRGQSGEDVP